MEKYLRRERRIVQNGYRLVQFVELNEYGYRIDVCDKPGTKGIYILQEVCFCEDCLRPFLDANGCSCCN
jgi:hypothetical protein